VESVVVESGVCINGVDSGVVESEVGRVADVVVVHRQ